MGARIRGESEKDPSAALQKSNASPSFRLLVRRQ